MEGGPFLQATSSLFYPGDVYTQLIALRCEAIDEVNGRLARVRIL